MYRKLALVTAFTLFIQLTNAQSPGYTGHELHVAKNGRDAGSGTAKAPFLTIGRAAEKAQPGDRIIIHAGTYREQVVLPAGGTSENTRITFMAAPGEPVTVKGSEVIRSWKAQGKGVWRADIPNSTFERGNPFTTFIAGQTLLHLGGLYVEGMPCQERPSLEEVNATAGSWFAEEKGDATSIWANFGAVDPNKETVEINNRPAAFIPAKPGISFITLDHISIAQIASDRASVDAAQPGAISTGGGLSWVIQNCEITDVKCVGIAMDQPGGHDSSRHSPARPAFGEFTDINAAGHHIIRNNFIHRCGQAAIFSLLHGTCSKMYGNQVEDIGGINGVPANDVAGIYLAVAVDAIIQGNLIRHIRGGSGITLGPLYQGTRITGNVIYDVKGSPLYFFRSHGLALIDNNVIVGPGADSSEGIRLRSAEANVFAQNLFAGCAFTNESLPARETYGTINYRPHSLVIKQTIPALPLDNKWFNNIFIQDGLASLAPCHGEADYNIYTGGAAQSSWGDAHSRVVSGGSGYKLLSTDSTVDVVFDHAALPAMQAPVITPAFIGRFALSQSIEWPDGKPIRLTTDFFGNDAHSPAGFAGPFAGYNTNNSKPIRVFQRRMQKKVKK